MASHEDEATGGTRGGTPEKPASRRSKASNDAVLRALEEVERTLERLKQARAERAEAEARYRAELASRDERLAEMEGRFGELERERAEAVARASALEGEHAGALARLGELERRVGELDAALRESSEASRAHESELESSRDEASERAESLERRLGELEAELDTERLRREVVEEKLATAESSRARAEEAAARLGGLESDLHARDEELAGVRRELESAREAACALEAGLAEARSRQEAIESERDALRSDVERAGADHRDALSGMESSLADRDRRLAELEARAAEAEQRAAARSAELQESASNQAVFEGEITAQRAEIAGLRGELDAARAEARASAERLADVSGETDARVAELRTQLEAAERREADLRRDCEAALEAATEAEAAGARASAEHAERLASLESELGAARESAAAIEARAESGSLEASEASARVSQLEGELASLRQELESARAALGAGARERAGEVEALQAKLAASEAETQSLATKLDLAADRLVALQSTLEEREAALHSLGDGDEAMAQVLRELAAARAEAEGLRGERDAVVARLAKAETGRRSRRGKDDSFLALRRQRLSRARRLLRDRVRSIDAHRATLERRLAQCDEVLARRRELVEARQIVEQTHQKVISGRARSSAAAMVFFATSLLAVLGVVSWAIVSQLYPATYAAAAVVSADFHGATPAEGERETWQSFHQQMLLDPQLMTRVAERMAQRGFMDLATPGDVKAKLDQDLTWTCPEAGKLLLELRGVGAERTARELDTYATTLAAESNALRQRRSDTATTIVAEPARAGTEPIVDKRPQQAAVGLAAGAVVSLLLWFGIWARMVRTKRAFESASQIDHLLEDGRWVDPIQQIIDAHAEGSRAA